MIQTEPMTVACLALHGSYGQIPHGFGVLYGWLAQQGITPAGMPGALYPDDLNAVPEDERTFEVWAPCADDAPEQDYETEARVPVRPLWRRRHRTRDRFERWFA